MPTASRARDTLSRLASLGRGVSSMREADDDAVKRAKRHYIDTRITTIGVSGDITDPINAGLIDPAALIDTGQLARGEKPGRVSPDEITFFKSGGGGHEDLGTAQFLLSKLQSAG